MGTMIMMSESDFFAEWSLADLFAYLNLTTPATDMELRDAAYRAVDRRLREEERKWHEFVTAIEETRRHMRDARQSAKAGAEIPPPPPAE